MDYETLKLLLSQIEVAYEEEESRDFQLDEDAEQPKSKRKRDYREQLFLESDSDEAFLSVDEDCGSDYDEDHVQAMEKQSSRNKGTFSLSYSSQENYSSSDEDYVHVEPGCIPSLGSSSSYYKKIGRKASQAVGGSRSHNAKKRSKLRTIMPIEEEDAFYNVNAGSGGSQSFYLPDTNSATPLVRNTTTDETTSLLTGTTSPKVTLFSYSTMDAGQMTPPRTDYGVTSIQNRDISPDTQGVPSLMQTQHKERQKARRERRRRMRTQRARKVPRHLRVAHAKARAITERFLGLMRSETEKVLLFAQARLGELADTAGALRFPTYEDDFNNTTTKHQDKSTTGSYQFGDGGIHPSDSSTSEEASQVDDSSEEQSGTSVFRNTRSNKAPSRTSSLNNSMPKSYSLGGLSDETAGNRSFDDADQKGPIIRTKDFENVLRSQRQISSFEELRKTRPLFQRNEMILGEDMLFLSAVEEADAFTAVGVELMHVLRYIALNLIAVRKICRKHDRLLMNRMLGGYYQRVRNANEAQKSYSHHTEDFETLGGLVARMSGDVFDAHPALIGQMNHYKLVGLYDKKIQKLANSRTVQVVSSCLALSLSEYEVARSRANALNKLQSGGSVGSAPMVSDVESVGDSVEDAPSTASSISLTRLRFVVMSIFALREASRSKTNKFESYFGRSTLSYSGQAEAGTGLDGCSRDTLDWIVTYNPDSALLLDSSLLYDGLKQNHWGRVPMAEVMISALAMGSAPCNMAHESAKAFLRREEHVVSHVLSLVPESKKNLVLKRLAGGQFAFLVERNRVVADEMPNSAVGLSRMWLFLFTVSVMSIPYEWPFLTHPVAQMNYYLSHTTTCSFLKAIGSQSAHSATIIGAPNVSAAFITLVHCAFSSRRTHLHLGTLRSLMLFASLMGVAGNALHAIAIDRASVQLVVFGRVLIGFCSAEVIQREILSACLPSHVVPEAARNALFRLLGVLGALFMTSAYMAIPNALENFERSRQLQGPNWFMMILWLVQSIRIVIELRPPNPPNTGSKSTREDVALERGTEVSSSSSDEVGTPADVLRRNIADATAFTRLANHFRDSEGGSDCESYAAESSNLDVAKEMPQVSSRYKLKTLHRIHRLCVFHIGIPVSLFIIFFCAYTQEIFYTATPLIGHRYFDWSGARAGVVLGSTTMVVFPVMYVCVVVASRYEERTVLKVCCLEYSCVL